MSRISKEDNRLSGLVHLPASKSISNRLLVLKFLHPEKISIDNLSNAEDTVLLESLLREVEEYVKEDSKRILTLHVANSGTTMRFLLALLSAVPGSYVLRGDQSMSWRPVRILVDALIELGADIQYLENTDHLPLFIKGRNLSFKEITVGASESSQHISALLLVATAISGGLNIFLDGQVVSRPYIDMTRNVLELCGFSAIWQGDLIRVFPGKVKKTAVKVETDWSSASFWYGMMALASAGELFLPGLRRTGMQGDETAVEFFSRMGVKSLETEKGITLSKEDAVEGLIEWDFRDSPDLAVPAVVSCALLGRKVSFKGLEGLRLKESDRIESLSRELARFNAELTRDHAGIWHLKPAKTRKKKITVDSHADHRIAMAMMMGAMKGIEMEIRDPEVVSKSYPGFWRDMQQAGFHIR